MSSLTTDIEQLRKRLLDLSSRNRLLNFSHSRGAFLRALDELPDQLYQLLQDNKELSFVPVPEPQTQQLLDAGYLTVDEEDKETLSSRPTVQFSSRPTVQQWAGHLGMNTGFDAPEKACGDKHDDTAIQTLHFPAELEARLRKIRTTAHSLMEETGVNALYLAFGFLEWYESEDSQKVRSAPLFLVPVELEKGKLNRQLGTYEYRLKARDEEIISNLSLKEKLRTDFGMALPDLDEEDTPEDYFRKVKGILHSHPRWQLRRYITLSLFNFSKLLMFLDLDPKRWPGASIAQHALVARFFKGVDQRETGSGSGEFLTEHRIDSLPDIHADFPLINDADSSQHSALIDALQGKNLVIEGPPGSGKSQTITNLVAGALQQGKKVLFVAEKMAALEVVRRKLDQAGLGDFCLELHSHKSQKTRVLEDIGRRIENGKKPRDPVDPDTTIRRYEELKEKLQAHAEAINAPWKDSGKTIHEILSAAVRFQQGVSLPADKLLPEPFDTASLTPYGVNRLRDAVTGFGAVYKKVAAQLRRDGTIQSHPWYGINETGLQHFDARKVVEALQAWQDSLQGLDAALASLNHHLGGTGYSTLQQAAGLCRDINSLPPLAGDEFLAAVGGLKGEDLVQAEDYLAGYKTILRLYERLGRQVREPFLADLDQLVALKPLTAELIRITQPRGGTPALPADVSLHELFGYQKTVTGLLTELDSIAELVTEIGQQLGDDFNCSRTGLSHLQFIITITAQLPASTLRLRADLFDNDELDECLPALERQLQALARAAAKVGPGFRLDALPDHPVLVDLVRTYQSGGLLRWCQGPWRQCRQQLLALLKDPSEHKTALDEKLASLVDYSQQRLALASDDRYRRLLGDRFQGEQTDVEALVALRAWYRAIRGRFGSGFGASVRIGDALLKMPDQTARGLAHLVDQGIAGQLEALLNTCEELVARFPGASGLRDPHQLLMGDKSPVVRLKGLLEQSLACYEKLLKVNDIDLRQVEQIGEATTDLQRRCRDFAGADIDSRLFGGALELTMGPGCETSGNHDRAQRTCQWARHVHDMLTTEGLAAAVARLGQPEAICQLVGLGKTLDDSLQVQHSRRQAFVALTGLDSGEWQQVSGESIGAIIQRHQFALEHGAWLSNWCDYIRYRETGLQEGFGRLIRAVEHQELPVDEVPDAYGLIVNELLAREIVRSEPALACFAGMSHEELQKQFARYDHQLKQLQRQKIASRLCAAVVPEGRSGGKASERSDLGLIKAELGKKKRHLPIRKLIDRAGEALVALKPCFMMGPMSVAQYLTPGAIHFDLVVMDEASQMKPEDALGAIARGAQLVVVGDPKQLPPTSFFDKALSEEDEEDLTGVEESESILDAASALFAMRRLRWHYRSRHESLIAFSNRAFYNSDLIVFPSPAAGSAEFGVKFSRVRGQYGNGGNPEEARVVAEAVEAHMLQRPDESLGVIAMNARQSEQIERFIEARLKDNPRFQAAWEKNMATLEPLFIKNLENVQGDERDVIFISFTYGPVEAGGKVPQRFGPINQASGWRRLNVLFTRSKKRMQVFSSLVAADVLVHEGSNKSLHALRDFLAYAETGRLPQTREATGRGPDSDFEIAVMTALGEQGFQCQPQVGVAGYFLDIAVRDPGQPGRYLMAVECDGATYHSAKSVRDRDRLRQEVLEGLGWTVRRIWSTDWFKNPKAALEPVIAELHRLKSAPVVEREPVQQGQLGFAQIGGNKAAVEDAHWHQAELDEAYVRLHHPDTDAAARFVDEEREQA